MAGGLGGATPVAAVRNATRDDQQVVRCRLDELATARLEPPCTIVIGAVADLDVTAAAASLTPAVAR